MNVAFFFRVKDVVNRDFSQKPLRAIKQKRKYFPKKVKLGKYLSVCCDPCMVVYCYRQRVKRGALLGIKSLSPKARSQTRLLPQSRYATRKPHHQRGTDLASYTTLVCIITTTHSTQFNHQIHRVPIYSTCILLLCGTV